MKKTAKMAIGIAAASLAVLGSLAMKKAPPPALEKDCIVKGVRYKTHQVVPCETGNECNTCWCELGGNVATTVKDCVLPAPDASTAPPDAGQPDVAPVAVVGETKVKRSGIAVRLSVRQEIVNDRLRVLVSFEFKNDSKRKQRLRRDLLSDIARHGDVELRVNVVDKDDYGVFYTGPFVRLYLPMESSEFVTLKPGESRVIPDLDFTDMYCWPDSAQKLTLWFEAQALQSSEEEILRSDPVSFDYRPLAPRPCPVEVWKKRVKLVRPGSPIEEALPTSQE
jgi:hypothetical protein